MEASRLLVDKSIHAARRRYGAWGQAVGRLHGSADLHLHDVPHFTDQELKLTLEFIPASRVLCR